MLSRPEFWIVAGPNGAGKTTLVQAEPIHALLPHVTFLNPDDVALDHLHAVGFDGFADAPDDVRDRAFLVAANQVFADLIARLDGGESVGVETVLSSAKYREVVESVLRRDGFVGLIYVWIDSPETACLRVQRRVARGGHDVPQGKIAARWRRSTENLAWFLPHASRFWIYDNSDPDPAEPPRLLAVGGEGTCEFVARDLPARLAVALRAVIL